MLLPAPWILDIDDFFFVLSLLLGRRCRPSCCCSGANSVGWKLEEEGGVRSEGLPVFFSSSLFPRRGGLRKESRRYIVENESSLEGARLGRKRRACFDVTCAYSGFYSRELTSPSVSYYKVSYVC